MQDQTVERNAQNLVTNYNLPQMFLNISFESFRNDSTFKTISFDSLTTAEWFE